MSERLERAIERSLSCDTVFAKSLSANDTGLTGGHQCGIYIQKQCVPLIFDSPFERGANRDRWATIVWNEEQETHSRFVYYGQKTRNEYRITNFGRGFELLKPQHTGDLVVICKESDDVYWAYTFSSEEDIEGYLGYWAVSPAGLNTLIKSPDQQKDKELRILSEFVSRFEGEFPSTTTMADSAERAYRAIKGDTSIKDPDGTVIGWTNTEYELFRMVEDAHYADVLSKPMESVEEFVKIGLEITNRRKSRAGKSLEHHLASIFDSFGLHYQEQVTTEGNKKPDFIFPSEEAYHDPSFPSERLVFLGSKTTCKDRWRQVLNEADRIPHKYLFTLQDGVSPNQLEEMRDENLTLVVPKSLHKSYPKGGDVITLREFIEVVASVQA